MRKSFDGLYAIAYQVSQADACRKYGLSDATLHNGRTRYGGL